MRHINLKNTKIQLLIIALISALAWSSSITNEYTGYDDIKLIVRNDRIQKGILYTAQFYWNIVSDSHNITWTNYPTVIYRPLEWTGSAIGYSIWGPRAWCFHLFVNFLFHILNSVLLFFMLRKLLGAFNPYLPFIIVSIWTVHPLHNEAVNMLTSGVGFLCSMLLMFSALTINLYLKELKSLRDYALLALSGLCFFISYLGAEMAIVGPVILTIFLAPRFFIRSEQEKSKPQPVYSAKFKKNKKTQTQERFVPAAVYQVFWSFAVTALYLMHRMHIATEYNALGSKDTGEFFERLFVLAPEIFFHYIKLLFFPIKLSIDEQHQVVLQDAFSPYHLLSFTVSAVFLVYMLFCLFSKSTVNKAIGTSLLVASIGIALALDIVPIYCLARERYTYIFVAGCLTALVLYLDRTFFNVGLAKLSQAGGLTRSHHRTTALGLGQGVCEGATGVYSSVNEDSERANNAEISQVRKSCQKQKLILSLIPLTIVLFSIRSFMRSIEWRDGEKFWTSTVNSADDIGVKQCWRYRLLEYYNDPGTATFKLNPEIRDEATKDFIDFPITYNLFNSATIQKIREESKKNHLAYKYGYLGNKAIASGLFFNAVAKARSDNLDTDSLALFGLSHQYYPEHFQTNTQLLIHLYKVDPKAADYILSIMDKEVVNNSFLAKGMMDSMFMIQHHRTYEYAKKFKEMFPDTQLFNVYLFHAAYNAGDYPVAYRAAKMAVSKYAEEDTFINFIKQYEVANR